MLGEIDDPFLDLGELGVSRRPVVQDEHLVEARRGNEQQG